MFTKYINLFTFYLVACACYRCRLTNYLIVDNASFVTLMMSFLKFKIWRKLWQFKN